MDLSGIVTMAGGQSLWGIVKVVRGACVSARMLWAGTVRANWTVGMVGGRCGPDVGAGVLGVQAEGGHGPPYRRVRKCEGGKVRKGPLCGWRGCGLGGVAIWGSGFRGEDGLGGEFGFLACGGEEAGADVGGGVSGASWGGGWRVTCPLRTPGGGSLACVRRAGVGACGKALHGE